MAFLSRVVALTMAVFAIGGEAPGRLIRATPESAGFPQEFTRRLDEALSESVETGTTAGIEGLVLVGRKIVYHNAFGYKKKVPRKVPLTTDTVFDLASLTKVLVTTPSLLILEEEDLVDLDAPVCRYIPHFQGDGRERVTLRHLLTHTSGLGNPSKVYLKCSGKKEYLDFLCGTRLLHPPGEKRIYSDFGMILAGFVVETVSGKPLDRFAEENLFHPLGMKNTTFNPPLSRRWRCAATEICSWRHRLIQGQVHDENAFAMGGVAGHAGLFSTAKDLAVFSRMLLDGGIYDNKRILAESTVEKMTAPQKVPGCSFQGLGWQIQEKQGQKTGWLLSDKTYGHTGFTGTSLWIDPENDTAAVLLANAIHPKRRDAQRRKYRAVFHRIVTEALKSRTRK